MLVGSASMSNLVKSFDLCETFGRQHAHYIGIKTPASVTSQKGSIRLSNESHDSLAQERYKDTGITQAWTTLP